MDDINVDYEKIVEKNQPEIKKALQFIAKEMDRQNCRFGENPLPTFLKPVFFSHEEEERFKEIIRHVVNILDKITRLYFSHPDLRDYYYIHGTAAKLLEIEHGYSKNVIISRPDSFFVNGTFRFVEFNCDSPAGCGLCDTTEGILRRTFPMKKIAEQYVLRERMRSEYLLNALLDCYREFAGANKKPNIAIVDWNEVSTQNEFQLLKKYFKTQGYDTIIADPRELKLSNGKLKHKGFTIDLVYRRVIFKELLGRLDQVEDFIEAYRQGKVCVVNPLRSKLASNKATLAIMTNQKDFKNFFSMEENRIIQKHIPWTRRVLDMETHYENNLVFLKKHIVSHKDSLVLKPSDSYGGKNVAIGCETGTRDWENLVNRIINNKEDWVVQKYVPITEMTVPVLTNGRVSMAPKKYNLNPFIFGGRYAGSVARLSEKSVINVSAGGGLVPVIMYARK